MKINTLGNILIIIFYILIIINILFSFLILRIRKSKNQNNFILEYSQLFILLITFLLSIKNGDKISLYVFLFSAILILIIRQIYKVKIEKD